VRKLLLHSCCAPCSTTAFARLAEHYDITLYYYNPNIDTIVEHDRRRAELTKLRKLNIPFELISEPYSPEDYNAAVKGLEHLGEGSARCYECYKLRLTKTAEHAAAHGFDAFTTTLSVSPYKKSEWLDAIGERLAKQHNIPYLALDLKKQNGYKESIETSKKLNLYRQTYCGCRYSRHSPA